jgi:hypothetical protein
MEIQLHALHQLACCNVPNIAPWGRRIIVADVGRWPTKKRELPEPNHLAIPLLNETHKKSAPGANPDDSTSE